MLCICIGSNFYLSAFITYTYIRSIRTVHIFLWRASCIFYILQQLPRYIAQGSMYMYLLLHLFLVVAQQCCCVVCPGKKTFSVWEIFIGSCGTIVGTASQKLGSYTCTIVETLAVKKWHSRHDSTSIYLIKLFCR
jgi:hypothetical protein